MIIAAALAAATLAPSAPGTLASAGAALGAGGALALFARRRLGGLTGNVYGAAIEIAELTFLTVASLG